MFCTPKANVSLPAAAIVPFDPEGICIHHKGDSVSFKRYELMTYQERADLKRCICGPPDCLAPSLTRSTSCLVWATSREGLLCALARRKTIVPGMWDSNFGPQQGAGQPPGLQTQSSQGQTILGDANSNAYGQNPSLEWLMQGEGGGGGPGGALVQELVNATNCSPMMCAQALQQGGDDPQRSAHALLDANHDALLRDGGRPTTCKSLPPGQSRSSRVLGAPAPPP